MNKVIIRGIDILAAKDQQVLLDFLLDNGVVKTGRLIAINAEKVILNEENADIHQAIADADYKYADGISIVYSIHKKYPQYHYLERIAGIDLWLSLMQRCAVRSIPVFLVGGQAGVLAQTFAKLKSMGVEVVGSQEGYFTESEENAVFERIKQSKAKVISVALGSPKQELFMQKAYQYYSDGLYMGVGGSYDVFVGNVKRAPICWQRYGIEWLYRLFMQPMRWKRQYRLLKYAYYYGKNKL